MNKLFKKQKSLLYLNLKKNYMYSQEIFLQIETRFTIEIYDSEDVYKCDLYNVLTGVTAMAISP